VVVALDRAEPGYDDQVVLRITASVPASQKLLRTGRLSLSLTVAEARDLARRLLAAAAGDATVSSHPKPAPARAAAPESPHTAVNSSPLFTATQGRYLGFIHRYQAKFGRAPAEADIQRHMLVAAPSVNQMMRTLERKGLIARTPGQARSIRLLVPPEMIPPA